jgi:ACS family hexuronate transporter-like MFS transporter
MTVHARRIRGLRWIIAGLLLAATTINYIDRQAISVAAPVISRDLNLSATDYSYIVFAFLLAYAVMQVVAGGLIDRIGTRRGFALAVTGWSIASMLHAAGTGVLSFSIYRFILGAFEAANFPAALKAIAEWFPRHERSTAVGILNVGPGLGAVIAPPLISVLILTWGWPQAFIVSGLFGFVWLALWLKVYDAPDRHPRITPEEAAMIAASTEPASTEPVDVRQLLTSTRMWGLMLARFTSDGAFYFFVFWLPKYLSDVRGFSLAEIGAFAWIPFLASDIGSLAGGWGGSALIRRGVSLTASRMIMIWAGAAFAAVAWPAAAAATPMAALTLIAIAMFGIQVKASALFTMPADIFPAKNVALAWGLSGAAGSIGGMLFQLYIGRMVDQIGYAPVFWVVSGMHILSAAIVLVMVRSAEPMPSKASGNEAGNS